MALRDGGRQPAISGIDKAQAISNKPPRPHPPSAVPAPHGAGPKNRSSPTGSSRTTHSSATRPFCPFPTGTPTSAANAPDPCRSRRRNNPGPPQRPPPQHHADQHAGPRRLTLGQKMHTASRSRPNIHNAIPRPVATIPPTNISYSPSTQPTPSERPDVHQT